MLSPAQQALAFAPASSLSGSQPRLPSAWPCPVPRNGFHLVMWKPLCLAARVGSSWGPILATALASPGIRPRVFPLWVPTSPAVGVALSRPPERLPSRHVAALLFSCPGELLPRSLAFQLFSSTHWRSRPVSPPAPATRVVSRTRTGGPLLLAYPVQSPRQVAAFRNPNSRAFAFCPRCPGGLAPGRCRRLGGSVARQVLASRPAGPPVAWRAQVVGVALGPAHFVRTSSSEVGLLPGLPCCRSLATPT
jgi:hypothetical protein